MHVRLIIILLLSYGNYEGQGKESISSLEINRSLKHVGAHGHCFPRSKRNSKVAADTYHAMQCFLFPFLSHKGEYILYVQLGGVEFPLLLDLQKLARISFRLAAFQLLLSMVFYHCHLNSHKMVLGKFKTLIVCVAFL